jgi:hypothetical protein
MTYRNKLLLKRFLIILGIVLLAVFLLLLLGFTYLGRYVVYTEDGAYFSFRTQAEASSSEELVLAAPPEAPVLVTGDSIYESEALGDEQGLQLADTEVNGLLLDYETLADGSTLNSIELTDESLNTLALEMRSGSSDILNTSAVLDLIDRAKSQGLRLVAMISCLNDINYAEAHFDQCLQTASGDRWLTDSGSYWLDPTNQAVQDRITDMILTLADMGFQEVILNNFSFPESESISYAAGDSTREELLIDAYESIEEAVGLQCTLGILVRDTENGHQAFDVAEHLYVYFSSGSAIKEYVEAHPDYYLVFVTNSHDTRFDDYGKLYTDQDVSSFSSQPTTSETYEEAPDEDTDEDEDYDTYTEYDDDDDEDE